MSTIVLWLNLLVFTAFCCAICFFTPLVSKYHLITLKAGLVYMFAVLLSIFSRLFLSVQYLADYGINNSGITITASILDIISLVITTLALPCLIHTYLEKKLPMFVVPISIIQIFSLPFLIFYFDGTYQSCFLYAVIVCGALFLIVHIYCLILMAINLYNKTLFQRSYLVYTLILGIAYLLPGIMDIFWPLFPEFIFLKEKGFNFSIFIPLLISFLVIPRSYHYLIKIGSDISENISYMLNQYQFTVREKEVFYLILKGYTNNQIAANLQISGSTVKKHVYSMFQKTDSENRIDLINCCRDN